MTKNFGGYRPFTITNKVFNLDSNTYSHLNNHINSITSSLFLNLSRGNRVPALFEETFVWSDVSFSSCLMSSIVQYEDSTTIGSIKVCVPKEISNISYIYPLIFVQSNNINIFVSVDSFSFEFENSYFILKLKKIEDGTFKNVLTEDLDFCNFSFSTTFVYQSIGEYNYYEVYYIGIPFLENISIILEDNRINLTGESFYYIDDDKVVCQAKGQLITESSLGHFIYGEKMINFDKNIDIDVSGLSSGTSYKVYYNLESIDGTKTTSNIFFGEYSTSGRTGNIPSPETPPFVYV